MCLAGVATCVTVILVSFPTGEAIGPTAEELIVSYEKCLLLLRHAEFRIEEKQYVRGGAYTEETLVFEGSWQCRHDGQRWKIASRGSARVVVEGKVSTQSTGFDYVIPGRPGIAMIYAQQTGPTLSVSAALDADSDAAISGAVYLSFSGLVYGYLQGDGERYLPDILRESQVTVRADVLEGVRVFVLESRGRYGTHRLWLDPRAGFLPRRMEIRKKGTDLFGTAPLNSYDGSRRGEGGPFPALPLLGFANDVDDISLQQIGDDYVIAGFTQVHTHTFLGGDTSIVRCVHALSDFNIEPDFSAPNAFEVSMDIPNGTEVSVEEAPHITYEWRDGEIVRTIDPDALASLYGLDFKRMVRSGRFWFLVINVVVATASVCFLVRRSRQRKPC